MFMVNQLVGFGAGGEAGFRPLAVHFDGDDAWLQTNGDHGASDNKLMLFSFQVRHFGANTGERWYWNQENLTYVNRHDGTELVQAISGAALLNVDTDIAVNEEGWSHLLFSSDGSTGTAHWYVNNVEAKATSPAPNVPDQNNDWTSAADWQVAATITPSMKFGGDMMELYVTNEYLDLSQEANCRKFIDNDGFPADLGLDGSLPTGSPPIIYLSRRPGDVADAFMTNRGSGINYIYQGSNSLLPGQEMVPWDTSYKEIIGTWDDPLVNATGKIIDSANGHGGFQISPTQSGTIPEAHIEVTSKGTAGHTSTFELWTDSSGSPGALVSNGASQAFAVDRLGVHKVTWTTPPSVAASTTYWLVIKQASSLFRLASVNSVVPGHKSGRNPTITSIVVDSSQPGTNENWRVQITVK